MNKDISSSIIDDFDELAMSHPLAISTEFDRKSKRRSQVLDDGRKILTYENGEELIEHSDGTLEQSTIDGSRIAITDFVKTETTKDGIVVTTDLQTGRIMKQETPDGIIIEFKQDGTKIEYFPNGTITTTLNDGTITEINHDSTMEVIKAIDGTITETNFKEQTKIITYLNGTKKQIDIEDGTEILEDVNGNLLQINPDGSKTCTTKTGRQTDILTDGTIIIEEDGQMIQRDADGSIVKGDGTVIEANDIDINLTVLFEQAIESTSENRYIPQQKPIVIIDEVKQDKNEESKSTEDIIKNGKNYTQEDFMIGLARIYPSSCTFSTNRNGLKKITAGKLIKSLEKQKLERQNEILIQKKKEKAEIMKRKKRNYHAGKKK